MNRSNVSITSPEEKQMTPIEQALSIDKDGFTSAKKLYAWLELDETHYSRWVQTNITENPFAEEGMDFSPLKAKSRKGVMGRPTMDYRLSASFAKKLAMMSQTARGEQARIYFLMCERALVQAAKEREKLNLERAKGIAVRRSLTDVIIETGENERMKGHGCSVYTDLVYKAAMGKNARQLREERGLDKKDNLRDALSAEELGRVKNVEQLVGDLLQMSCPYPEIKEFVMNQSKRMHALTA